MADEELDEAAVNDGDKESVAEEGEGKKKFSLSAGALQILKTVLQYMIIIILTIGVAWMVASRASRSNVAPMAKEDLTELDPPISDGFEPRPAGLDWTLKEMMVNTADEDEQHFVRASIVVSYDENNKKILTVLEKRRTEIRSEIRNIIGSKKFSEVNTTIEQRELVREIKERVQLVVQMPGVYEIYLNDFTVH